MTKLWFYLINESYYCFYLAYAISDCTQYTACDPQQCTELQNTH